MTPAPAILIIEDDEDIRETLVDALCDEGLPAVGAADGASALSFLRASPTRPEVIFLDLMMPGMSGADFLAAQRSVPALAKIPVVILSADAGVRAKAAELGASDGLRKPIRLQKLIEAAARFMPHRFA